MQNPTDGTNATNPFSMFLNTILEGILSGFSWIFKPLTSIFNFMFSASNADEKPQVAPEHDAPVQAAAEHDAPVQAAAVVNPRQAMPVALQNEIQAAAAARAAVVNRPQAMPVALQNEIKAAAADARAALVNPPQAMPVALQNEIQDAAARAAARAPAVDEDIEVDVAPRKTPCQSFLSNASSYVHAYGLWALSGAAAAGAAALGAYNYYSGNANP